MRSILFLTKGINSKPACMLELHFLCIWLGSKAESCKYDLPLSFKKKSQTDDYEQVILVSFLATLGYLAFLTFTEHQVCCLYFVSFDIIYTFHVEHDVTAALRARRMEIMPQNTSKHY